MILHLDPGTPLLIRSAAAAALGLHTGGASVGLVSGAVALVARKGERQHRVAGTVFFVSMLTMSGIAAVVAPLLRQWSNVFGGLFSGYLVATSWATVMRPAGRIGRFEVGALFVPLGAAAASLWFAWVGAHSPGA